MHSANLDYHADEQTTQDPAAANSFLSFLCPCCSERLNVSNELAGISGPCPACAEMIRAPQAESPHPIINPRFEMTTSEIVLPSLEQDWGAGLSDTAGVGGAPIGGFQAVKKIAAAPPEAMDETWREKHERERKLSRRRHRIDRLFETMFESRGAKKFRGIGLAVITGILVVTMAILYFNNRSGGALLRGVFGQ